MNKEEFLKSLTKEQLAILSNITHTNIINELNKRKPKKVINIKIGDCFIYRENPDELYLIKVTAHEHNDWFTCDEISIDEHEIDCYDVSYHLDKYSDWEPLDSSIYDKILALINVREDTVNQVVNEFNKQIRELCSTSLNIPKKN